MKIKKMIEQYRRDFHADFECEGCGYIAYGVKGYDDRNFHDNVIPNWKCPECDESRNDLGIKAEPTETKYKPWEIV